MTFADLRALHAILGDAIDDIQRVYAPERAEFLVDTAPQTLNSLYASPPPSPSTSEFPLDFPSLDQPYDPNDPAEQFTAHPTVVTAINRIIAAAGQMAIMVQPPFYAICDAAMGYHLPSCLRVLEASHTVEILREAGPEGMHVDIISERNGVESRKLAHILRLLATHHIIRERSPNIFTLNRISSLMDSGKSFQDIKKWEKEGRPETKYRDTDGVGAFVGLCADELFKSSSYLTEAYLRSRMEPSRTPFEHAFNTDLDFFAWLEEESSRLEREETCGSSSIREGVGKHPIYWNKFRLERFGVAMSGTGSWEAPGAVFNGFDWRNLPRGSVIVDVGGGIGSTSMLLANAFSHPSIHQCNARSFDGSENVNFDKRTEDQELGFKFIIQDRPVVVEMGEKAWRNKCPEYLDSGTVEFQVHDFFTAQPIKNAAVFLLRVIMHDWPDAQARMILVKLREAARPDTKLVLADFVLPLACVDDGDDGSISEDVEGAKDKLAPPPLLANLGKASANAYWMDLTMHVTFNAQERTLREIHALALSAGWKVVKVTHAPGSLFGHIVAVPVSIPTQGRAGAGSESSFTHISNIPFQSVKGIDERFQDGAFTLQRASSRCGTPTFGSQTILPSVQEKISRFGGVKSRVSRLAEKLRRPASGILKQAAVITTSAALGKKKPSPLSFSSPVRGSMDSSPGPPRQLQPPSPLAKKISLMQPGSASSSHVSQQSPPSPLSPMFPKPQLGFSRNEWYTQPSRGGLPMTANYPSSPTSQGTPLLPPYQTLRPAASHANLSRRSDSVSTTSSILPSSPLQSQLEQLSHPRTLLRPKSHAQLHQLASSQAPVPIPTRQTGNKNVITQDSSSTSPRPLSPLHPSPNTSLTARSKSFPSPKPYQTAIHHRSSFAQLRPPQVTLRKRSGTLVAPNNNAGMGAGHRAHRGTGALAFGDNNDNGGSDREVAYGQDFEGGGSLLAAAAVIDSTKGNTLKARAGFSNE